VRSPLPVGEQYPIVLEDGIDGSTISIVAEVMWTRQGRAGLRWVELTAQQDVWLLNHFQSWFQHMQGASRR
jgi:hypothetical protein